MQRLEHDMLAFREPMKYPSTLHNRIPNIQELYATLPPIEKHYIGLKFTGDGETTAYNIDEPVKNLTEIDLIDERGDASHSQVNVCSRTLGDLCFKDVPLPDSDSEWGEDDSD